MSAEANRITATVNLVSCDYTSGVKGHRKGHDTARSQWSSPKRIGT